MILSRLKPAKQAAPAQSVAETKEKKKLPELEEFLDKRDYTGAISLLSFQRQAGKGDEKTDLWLGYCFFHLGDYKKAADEYERIIKNNKKANKEVYVYWACCMFYLGMYKEANDTAQKSGKNSSALQNRLLFHVSHKLNDEKMLMQHHRQLQDILEDQLCLASIHYLRSHFQEAIDIYKRILLTNRNFIAINVYLALCYYKLDYYDVSSEVLSIYHQKYPDSVIAVNLKACNQFKLYNGKTAEQEFKALEGTSHLAFAHDVVQHNLVVFRGGENALQTLPPLVDVLPEARLNLVIYHLKRQEFNEAFDLLANVEPSITPEFILKAIVHCKKGQLTQSKDHLKTAQQFFQMVGGSAAECDTIPGRQCMASCYFLLKQFEEVLIYLNSIKTYFYNDDTFNFNFGQVQTALGNYQEAEQALLLVQDDTMTSSYAYNSTLAKCHVMNQKARLAWELYLRMDLSSESFNLLNLIANDCYRMGSFYYAAKAFDVLERLDPSPEYWEGKRGACCGAFQLIIAGKEPTETLREVIQMLQSTSHPQVEQIVRVMRKWAKENRVPA